MKNKTARELINSIHPDQSNFLHIISTRKINGSLLTSMENIMKEYAEQIAILVRQECANKATTETCHKKYGSQEIVNSESILSVNINQFLK